MTFIAFPRISSSRRCAPAELPLLFSAESQRVKVEVMFQGRKGAEALASSVDEAEDEDGVLVWSIVRL